MVYPKTGYFIVITAPPVDHLLTQPLTFVGRTKRETTLNKLRFAFIASILVLSAGIATAKTISGAYVGCLTETALDEFTNAAVNEDYRQMQALTGTVCASIEGREFSVVDRGWMTSQIRVYVDGSSVLLWTVSEAIK